MDSKYWAANGSQQLPPLALVSGILSSYHISALLFIVAVLSLYIVYCRFWSPLAGIPGPFAASLSRLWLVQQSRAGNMHRTMIDLHSRHGEIVRIGPNEVSVTNPEVIKKIYGRLPPSPLSLLDWTESAERQVQVLEPNSAKVAGTVSFKAVANSTYSQSRMNRSMASNGDSSVVSILPSH